MYHYTECGLRNVWLENGYEELETEYGKAVGIHNVEGLHQAIALHLVTNKPRLSGTEVRFIRKYLNMSQNDLAFILGVGETSVRRWEKNRGVITKPAERLLRVLVTDHECGDGTTKELVARIANINRDAYHKKLQFSEEEERWKAAA